MVVLTICLPAVVLVLKRKEVGLRSDFWWDIVPGSADSYAEEVFPDFCVVWFFPDVKYTIS